jgi:hypothetical protein
VATKKNMPKAGTESLELKKMMYKNKEKKMGMMCGGKAHRAKKAMGGMMKGSQPEYKEVMPKCMPN